MKSNAIAALLVAGFERVVAQSYSTSFKSVSYQPLPLDVTIAEWDLFDHESALYLTCPHESNVVDAGPVIYDGSGNPVWMDTGDNFSGKTCHDVNVQTINGTDYLTVWAGDVVSAGYGEGSGLVFDNSFNLVNTLNTGNGYESGM